MFCYNLKVCEVLQLFYFLHLVTPDDLEWLMGDLWPLYPLEPLLKCLNLTFEVSSWIFKI